MQNRGLCRGLITCLAANCQGNRIISLVDGTRAFIENEVFHAGIIELLTRLAEQYHQDNLNYGNLSARSTRIYNDFEHERLDAHCRGYITYLEQTGILSPSQRELLVDRLLALESADIDVEQIKWVVLMVLFSQPGQEQAYARMEDLVFDESAGSIH